MTSAPGPGAGPDPRAAFGSAGQGHVFRFWGELTGSERASLSAQAAGVDLGLFERLRRLALSEPPRVAALSPFPVIGFDDPARAEAESAGRDLLARGTVGFLTVAGGQSTRLGSDVPKGARPIGPFSGKSLFRWHAEKVLAASRRYGRALAWVIMTSDSNAAATEARFAEEDWFGLAGRVLFVRQRMLPAVDDEGKILLEAKGRIAMSPNGHGGTIEALARGGAIEWLADRNVAVLSYFQVDNALVNPADPAFLGFHSLRGAEMSAKVVVKADPLEKAGIVAYLDGKPGVLEYSELPEDVARATDDAGTLLYPHVSIAAHVFDVAFLNRMKGHELPYHPARKNVVALNRDGHTGSVPGIKFESFIFDAIPLARRFAAVLTTREEEFAPLKNATGENSPETVHAALKARTRGWYVRAGLPVPDREEDLEVSPLSAYDYETFLDFATRRGRGDRP